MKQVRSKLISGTFMLIWGSLLAKSDAFYLPYLLLCLLGFSGLLLVKEGPKLSIRYSGPSALLSLLITLSNYRIWLEERFVEELGTAGRIYQLLLFLLISIGGFCVLLWGLNFLLPRLLELDLKRGTGERDIRYFLIPFALLVFTQLLVLFLCRYPAVLTDDSINQLNQILSGSYSNHHPYYHTLLVRLFVGIGTALFGNLAAGIACYTVFQLLCLDAVFAFVPYTLYELGIAKPAVKLAAAAYLLLPYHLVYAVTLWKDILFSAAVLLLCVVLYRVLKGLRTRFDAALLFASALAVCLLRSNGFLAFVLMAAGFFVMFGKERKRLCFLFLAVILLSFVLKNPVLKRLQVSQPDTVESLSVPLQQIARVLYDGKTLRPEERDRIERIADPEAVCEVYRVYISDPVKNLIREKGDQTYITAHKGELLKLYLSLGLRYPWTYLKAYVDQTRGYYNSGYSYWYYVKDSLGRELGIPQQAALPLAGRLLGGYLWLFDNNVLLQLFISIGFHVWILLLLALISLLKKDKTAFLTDLPLLALLASLLAATPVYSEFRYIYALFCVLPFSTALHFCKEK